MKGAVASKIRAGIAMAVGLAGASAARAQPPTISIQDVRVVEGNSSWSQPVTVTLSAATSSPVTVTWTTVSGSATASVDFVPDSNTVTFPPFSTSQTFFVTILGNSSNEWSQTLQMDETFFIDLSSPSNATLLKSRATVTIVDDDRPYAGLQLVSAVADGPGGSGRVRLQWRVPPAPALSGPVTDVLVRWNVGTSCTAPANPTDAVTGGQFLISSLGVPLSPPGGSQVVEHLGRPFVKHCYGLFAVYATPASELAQVVATPFDSTAPSSVAWAFSAGGTSPSVVPPTVGPDAVYTMSMDGVLHAMERGGTGGTWPSAWNPVALGRPSHNRSPVVPLPYGRRLLIGTEFGEVHAVDGENGSIAWSRSNSSALPTAGGVQGTPAVLLTSYGGRNDVIVVGTTSGNTVYMLDPVNGGNVSTYSHGLIGGVLGMPVIDYSSNTAFFLTTLPTGALWAFDLGPTGVPGLTASALTGGNPVPLTYGSSGSPVLNNQRIYFGTTNGDVIAYRPASGLRSLFPAGDGEVKGFVFPDRRNTNFYFSTNGKVLGMADNGSPDPNLVWKWTVNDISSPSMVLLWPGTNYLYVGGGDGRLYQIDVSSGSPQSTKKSVLLESGSQIGAPSLDGPNNLVLVGSATGVVYAVRVPLP